MMRGTNTTSIANHITYNAFGQITSQTDPSRSPLFKYTGRYFDTDTGLQWNNSAGITPACTAG